MTERIAILGWGSLLWEKEKAFAQQHDDWQPDGPIVKIEFTRISSSRSGALTLVLDQEYGATVRSAYGLSKRNSLQEAIEDLREREGTTLENIGYSLVGRESKARDEMMLKAVGEWASRLDFTGVVWTDLKSNFATRKKCPFSIENARAHLLSLDAKGKALAGQYFRNAPRFVTTPLRSAVADLLEHNEFRQ